MKVFLVRDISSEYSRYVVNSESGILLFSVSGRHTAGSQKMYVQNDDECVAKIREVRIANIKTNYVSTKEDKFHIVVTQKRGKLSAIYHGIGFHIRGDVSEKSYDIMDIDNSVIACVQKRFNTSKETFEININNDKYLVHCIVSAVCMNCVCTTDALALQAT